MIDPNKDKDLLDKLERKFGNILTTVEVKFTDSEVAFHNFTRQEQIEFIKKEMKSTMIKDNTKEIEEVIKDKYGLNVKIKYGPLKEYPYLSIFPTLNYKVLNIISSNLDKLFPNKKGSLLWLIEGGYVETKLYKILDNIRKDLKGVKSKLLVDKRRGKIYGLEEEIPIIIDFGKLVEEKISPKEALAGFLKEIGKIFVSIEYVWLTTNTNIRLIDEFIKSKGSKKALSVALGLDGDMIVPNLDTVLIKTYDLKGNHITNGVDLDVLSMMFVNRHGLGAELMELTSKFTINRTLKKPTISLKNLFINLLILVGIALLVTFLGFTILLTLGLSVIALGILSAFEKLVRRFLFNRDINGNDLERDIKILMRDIIRQIRNYDLNKEIKDRLIYEYETLEKQLTILKKYTNEYKTISSYLSDSDKREKIEEMVEDLTENKLHILKEKK